jgi:aconitate hydratase
VLPLQFEAGESVASLGLTGRESFTIEGIADGPVPRGQLTVVARTDPVGERPGGERRFSVRCRLDGPIELDYYRHGGILPAVLRRLAQA